MGYFAKLAVLATLSVSAQAAVIDIGSGQTTPPGDCTIGCMQIYQQAYDSSYFDSVPVILDSLSIYGQTGGAFGSYDVSIGYMNGDYSAITTNFAANFGSSAIQTDSIDLATDIIGGVLTVDLNFEYNASLGDLLVQFTRTSATSSGNFVAASGYNWSRAYEWPSGGDAYANSGYALNSTFNVSQVPIPAAVWLFGSGLGLLGWFRRRQSV
jgi:hypothetical protein